jgi:integrase
LFQRLPAHLQRMALFKVNTGTREQELCQLRWEWERRIPELNCSVFVIPAYVERDGDLQGLVKNREDRLVVLNRIAQSVIEEVRGQHPEFVFTFQGKGKKDRGPVTCMNNTAWQRARRESGMPVRVHDLKHT